MRCREDDRTHLDCPEYIRQQEGRDAQGFEDISAHRNTARPAPPRRNSARSLTVGGVDTTGNSASTNQALDDAGFSSRVQAQTGEETTPNRLRDVFSQEPETPDWQLGQPGQTLPATPSGGSSTNNDWILAPTPNSAEPDTEDDELEVIELP